MLLCENESLIHNSNWPLLLSLNPYAHLPTWHLQMKCSKSKTELPMLITTTISPVQQIYFLYSFPFLLKNTLFSQCLGEKKWKIYPESTHLSTSLLPMSWSKHNLTFFGLLQCSFNSSFYFTWIPWSLFFTQQSDLLNHKQGQFNSY